MNTDMSHHLHGVVPTAANREPQPADRRSVTTCARVSNDPRMSRLGVLLAIATVLLAPVAAPLRARQAAVTPRGSEHGTGPFVTIGVTPEALSQDSERRTGLGGARGKASRRDEWHGPGGGSGGSTGAVVSSLRSRCEKRGHPPGGRCVGAPPQG